MGADPLDAECPHGFPLRYVKRCADCRRQRRRDDEAARFKAAMAKRWPTLDVAALAANDRDDDDDRGRGR